MFTCIYCLKNEPHVVPSEAHIFPDGMGGVSFVRDKVCKDCNHKINRSFEQKEVEKFSFFQSIWGIKGRRGKIRKVPAIINFEGKRTKISLDERGIPKSPLVLIRKDDQGKKFYDLIGPSSLVEKKKKEIESKNPQISWKEKDLTNTSLPNKVVEVARDISRNSLRRLVTKVAYDRWGQLRDASLLSDDQYNDVRNFILNGAESHILCGILNDHYLLNGLLNFPVSHHAVVTIAHPQSRVLGSFVTFYGLFYFWVMLSTNYQALAAVDDVLIEDPQRQIFYEPILRKNTGNLLVHWEKIKDPYLSNPEKVINSSMEYAVNRFKKAKPELSGKMRHVLSQPIIGEGDD